MLLNKFNVLAAGLRQLVVIFNAANIGFPTLSEIAEIIGGTRQAAQELIRRAEGRLNQMEQQLQLVQCHNAQRRLVTAALAALKAGNTAEAANYLSQLENQL